MPADPQASPPILAAAAHGEDSVARQEYEDFCASVYVKPGVKLMDFLKRHRVSPLREWLHWQTPEAEPKAVMRMLLELTRQGTNLWDVPGLSMHLKGRWEQGGGPSKTSQDAISQLAQVMGKPITVYFEPSPGAPTQALDFHP